MAAAMAGGQRLFFRLLSEFRHRARRRSSRLSFFSSMRRMLAARLTPASRFLPSSLSRNLPSASTRRTTISRSSWSASANTASTRSWRAPCSRKLHFQPVGEERRADRASDADKNAPAPASGSAISALFSDTSTSSFIASSMSVALISTICVVQRMQRGDRLPPALHRARPCRSDATAANATAAAIRSR